MRAVVLLAVFIAGLAAQEPYKVGGGVSAPVPTFKVQPGYSGEAKAARVEGQCVMALVIGADGVPRDIQLVRMALREKETGKEVEGDFGLAKEATAALEQWRFEPGKKDGKAVAVKANVEMNFRLN
jgi:outer membrane biosynthesis protein TonB